MISDIVLQTQITFFGQNFVHRSSYHSSFVGLCSQKLFALKGINVSQEKVAAYALHILLNHKKLTISVFISFSKKSQRFAVRKVIEHTNKRIM